MIEYIEIIKKCPYCNIDLIVKEDNNSKFLFCPNENCNCRLINRFDHFCGKKGLDIKGLSKATLSKLMDWGWLQSYQDFFILKQYRDKWIKKPGFGVASVDKILNAIEVAKANVKLEQVIAAAGIPEIGSRVAKDIAKHYETWADFRAETNFLKIDGIGEVMDYNLTHFDYDDLELDYTVNLHLKAGITNTRGQRVNTEAIDETILKIFDGKVFCITGKTHIFKNRAELTADIELKGGKVVSSISSKVNYLINNDNTSTSAKSVQAKKLNIQVITEEEYLKLD